MSLPDKIERIKVADLVPYARNARTHSEEQIELLARSINEFGFINPVLIDNDGGIVAGHGRVMAAKLAGLAQVPCLRVGHLSDAQKRAYVLADNKMALHSGWDKDLLAEELRALKAEGFDLALTAFAEDEFNDLTFVPQEAEGDEDDVPAVQATAIAHLGDVWVLGNHRIMCGDSTNTAHVAQLMDGNMALLMQTDPPYGIAYVQNAQSKGQGEAHVDIENDDLDGPKLQAFLEDVIRAAVPHLTPNAAFYLWHPMLTQGTFFAAAAAAAILIHRQIIWCKPSLVFGRGDYHWQHELCFYGWRKGFRPPFYGPRNQTTMWQIDRETNADHPTAKPVELWIAPIKNHTKIGEAMYEPFSGSGSQIIAAEKTGRRCFAMEISPQYVDLAVRRWQQYTGQRATHAVTGEPFPTEA